MSLPARAGALLAALLAAVSLCACAEEVATRQGPQLTSGWQTAPAVPGASASAVTSPTSGYFGLDRDPPVPAVPFTLTAQDGSRYRFPRDAHGKVTLVYFGYAHCPDICPGTLAGISVALRGLPESTRKQVDVLFVTVDPARDTPEALAEYVGLFSEDFVGLTGSEEGIQAILASLGLPPALKYDLGGGEYGVGHPAGVLAFTPDGYAHLEYPFEVTAEMLQHDLTKLVEEGWQGS
jgi:protein SCO1/2